MTRRNAALTSMYGRRRKAQSTATPIIKFRQRYVLPIARVCVCVCEAYHMYLCLCVHTCIHTYIYIYIYVHLSLSLSLSFFRQV